MPTTNTDVVHRFYRALQAADYPALIDLLHPEFVFYSQIDTPRPGAEGFLEAEQKNVEAFSGLTLTVAHTVAEGDNVGAYVVTEGDQTGVFHGVEPHGGHVRISMFNLFTFKDGKIVEKRAHYNMADILSQLTAGAA